mmetsp:Transcript_46988/g.107981  ORF Transcript_46988/g.107981 Transcript_46988/m.107981 type:complete len:254 (-) Transcript_46988:547-1308(-)
MYANMAGVDTPTQHSQGSSLSRSSKHVRSNTLKYPCLSPRPVQPIAYRNCRHANPSSVGNGVAGPICPIVQLSRLRTSAHNRSRPSRAREGASTPIDSAAARAWLVASSCVRLTPSLRWTRRVMSAASPSSAKRRWITSAISGNSSSAKSVGAVARPRSTSERAGSPRAFELLPKSSRSSISWYATPRWRPYSCSASAASAEWPPTSALARQLRLTSAAVFLSAMPTYSPMRSSSPGAALACISSPCTDSSMA